MRYLHIDLRALSLMRMCLAAVIMFDLGIRMTDLEAFYSDTGVMPLNALFQHGWSNYYLSLHAISGSWQVQLILFLLAFFCAVMLFLGYRTRLFTFLSWFLMLSLHNRNGFILQGGDDLLRMILFWAIFLPWGARYSCDRLLDKETSPPGTIFNAATIAYLLQVSYLYTGSALLKGPEWHTSYTALYYTYSLDQIAYPVTRYIYYYPELLEKLTFVAYYFELLVPLLFLVPFRHQWFRTAGVLFVCFFHLLNASTLFIGLFPLIGIVTVLGLLPSGAMDVLEKKAAGIKGAVIASFASIGQMAGSLILWKKPAPVTVLAHRFRNAALIFLILFVFDWNLSNLSNVNSKLSDKLRFIGYGLRLDQSWGMFAPGVFKDDGWYVLEGVTRKGRHIDLLRDGKDIDYSKPESVVAMFRNDRWRKYTENLILSGNDFLRGYYSNYSKRIWNETNPENAVDTLRVLYISEFTQPDYKYSVPEKLLLWECY